MHPQLIGKRLAQAKFKRCCLLVAGYVICGQAHLAQAENFFDITAGLNSDSNVTRGFLESDQYRDESLNLDLTAGYVAPLQPGRAIVLFTTLSAMRFNELSGLDSQSLGVGSRYQYKHGLGPYAPTIAATLSWTQHNSAGKTRDRYVSAVELRYSKRLTAAWNTRFGAAYEISEGINDDRLNSSKYSPLNDIFDFDQFRLFAGVDYTFVNNSTLSAGYTWVDGNTVSSALAPNPRLLAISRALTLDTAVKAPPGRDQVAYTLASHSHFLSLIWSIPANANTSVNLGFTRHDVRAKNNINYGNNQFSVTILRVM